jgi:predicted RNA-binding protein with PIN domain
VPVLDALALAVSVARRDVATAGAPAPPRPLRAVLRFTRLPEKALQTVRRTLEDDEAFRLHVVEGIDPRGLSRGGQLFLERPEGWQEELDLLVELELDRQQGSRVEELQRRIAALEGEVSSQRRRAEATERSLRAAGEREAAVDADLGRTRRELEALRVELDAARDERAEAVRQLKDAEALAARRLEALRRAELDRGTSSTGAASTGAPSAAEPAGRGDATPEPAAVRRAHAELADAAERARELASRLEAAASAVGSPPSRPPGAARRSGTRVPVRLRRGAMADSAEGLAQLLEVPDMVVLVDGYNVSMTGWPEQPVARQRDRLLDLLAGVVAQRAADVHVVFDGSGVGERPAVSAPLPVRVHFTEAGVEADDRLIGFARDLPASRPVTVVSSDRRVRDGARRWGANVASSAALVELGRG